MDILFLIAQLFWTFFVIGAFTIGGGYAMLSLIQNEVVVHHAWITEGTFTDIVAISQMTPGPIGINTATYVGYEVLSEATGSPIMGVLGSLSATLAIVLPSFAIMLLIVRFYQKVRTSKVYAGVMSALRPTVAGLIGAAAVMLMFRFSFASGFSVSVLQETFPDWKAWLLFASAFAASQWGKVNPILLIIIAALAGIIIY